MKRMPDARNARLRAFSIPVIALAWLFMAAATPFAEASSQKRPRGPLFVAPEYSGLIVARDEPVRVDLVVTNLGETPQNVALTIPEVPKGWKARIRTRHFEVTGVHVGANATRKLTLEAEPDPDLPSGLYLFPIEARFDDGELCSSAQLRVTVAAKASATRSHGVSVTTSYPVLQGPTDAEFEFNVDVENRLNEDTTFHLSAGGPDQWEIHFKPAYEDKVVSSLHIRAGESRSMAVTVRPRASAGPGDYPIRLTVRSEQGRAEAEFTVVLTGTHRLGMRTSDDRLSLSARQGRPSRISFHLENTGSAPLKSIRFLSFKPENWDVTFEPDQVEMLPPGGLQQVEAFVTPAEQALVGDYSVGLSARGKRVSRELELRVSVRASTAWGWAGIGIILFVILGLVILFIRMGRR